MDELQAMRCAYVATTDNGLEAAKQVQRRNCTSVHTQYSVIILGFNKYTCREYVKERLFEAVEQEPTWF